MNKRMVGAFISVFGLILMILGFMAPTSGADEVTAASNENTKVFVCKYETTPGGEERLQTGDNPINVSINAIPLPADQVQPGAEFHDAQGRSLVIAFDTGQDPEPSAADCPPPNGGTTTTSSTTTSTTEPPTTTTSSTSTTSSTTTSTSTTQPTTTSSTSTTEPPVITQFAFGAAGTVCSAEVPFISITFANTFPELAGLTGTLFIDAIDETPVGEVELVYEPGQTVLILYPGAEVDAQGNIIDLPGWTLQANGLWVIDSTDDFLRDGLLLRYELGDEVATAEVTYPPESSTCANPPPPGPTTTTTTVPGQTTTTFLTVQPPGQTPRSATPSTLPRTGSDSFLLVWIGAGLLGFGIVAMRKSAVA